MSDAPHHSHFRIPTGGAEEDVLEWLQVFQEFVELGGPSIHHGIDLRDTSVLFQGELRQRVCSKSPYESVWNVKYGPHCVLGRPRNCSNSVGPFHSNGQAIVAAPLQPSHLSDVRNAKAQCEGNGLILVCVRNPPPGFFPARISGLRQQRGRLFLRICVGPVSLADVSWRPNVPEW